MTMKLQKQLLKVIWKYNSIPTPKDIIGVEAVCALHNLGIVEVKGDTTFFKSAKKARDFLN